MYFAVETKLKKIKKIKKNIDTGWTCVLCDQSKRKLKKKLRCNRELMAFYLFSLKKITDNMWIKNRVTQTTNWSWWSLIINDLYLIITLLSLHVTNDNLFCLFSCYGSLLTHNIYLGVNLLFSYYYCSDDNTLDSWK